MTRYRFDEICRMFAVPRGFGDKSPEEIEALGARLVRDGWRDDEPLEVRCVGGTAFRHPLNGNHRLRALWHLRAWEVTVPVRFVTSP